MKIAVARFVAIAAVVMQNTKQSRDLAQLLEMAQTPGELAIIISGSWHTGSMTKSVQKRKRKIQKCANGVPNGIGTVPLFASVPLFAGSLAFAPQFVNPHIGAAPRGGHEA